MTLYIRMLTSINEVTQATEKANSLNIPVMYALSVQWEVIVSSKMPHFTLQSIFYKTSSIKIACRYSTKME